MVASRIIDAIIATMLTFDKHVNKVSKLMQLLETIWLRVNAIWTVHGTRAGEWRCCYSRQRASIIAVKNNISQLKSNFVEYPACVNSKHEYP